MISVKCDLCSVEVLFDPLDGHGGNSKIEQIAREHVCKKPEKAQKKVREYIKPRPKFFENIFKGRKYRLGPPEEE